MDNVMVPRFMTLEERAAASGDVIDVEFRRADVGHHQELLDLVHEIELIIEHKKQRLKVLRVWTAIVAVMLIVTVLMVLFPLFR